MSKVKKIYCIHHSHFDLGYTHPQELILELQEQYISDAIELCNKYRKKENPFRWTIEATLPLMKWLDDATKEQTKLLKELIDEGLVSVCALPMHTTPLNDAFQLKKLLEFKRTIEEALGIKITTAINHDINGQSWSFSDILLDAGVEFYLTGENIHFGGIPFQRPVGFNWITPSSKKLLCFLGEHYSLFSQFLKTDQRDVELMHKGLMNYLSHLDEQEYDKDYIVLTATNPPLLDNNAPDAGLFELIQLFNEKYPEYEISFITPEMLHQELLKGEIRKEVSGDWTDFWNFGAGSTPFEVKYNRIANQNIKKASLFEVLVNPMEQHYKRLKDQATMNSLLYNEHTWGAANSITEPYSLQAVIGKNKKKEYCFDALSQSAYVLNEVQDRYFDIRHQNEEIGYFTFTNTSGYSQIIQTKVPKYLLENTPYLTAFKSNIYLHETIEDDNLLYGPIIELPAFASKSIGVEEFKERKVEPIEFGKGIFETENFKLIMDRKTGKITSLMDKETQRELVNDEEFGLFDYVVETIDASKNPQQRSTFFPRDIELANYSISVWNHDWQGVREAISSPSKITAYREGNNVVIETKYDNCIENVEWLIRKITLDADQSVVRADFKVKRMEEHRPNSHYITLPTNLKEGWESVFESADTLCRLDDDQIGAVSKDWVTIGNSISFFDDESGLCLATGDAPLVQVNGFSFGRESKEIERNEKPMILSWIYNNYWDTNFSSSDENVIEHQYVIKSFSEYEKEEQVKLGISVANPVEYTWNTVAVEKQLPFEFKCKNVQILSIEKMDDKSGQIFVKNYSDEVGTIGISRGVRSVKRCGLLGNVLTEIEENDLIEIESGAFGYIIVNF